MKLEWKKYSFGWQKETRLALIDDDNVRRAIAIIKYNDGTVIVKEAFTRDGEWTVEKKNINCKVIAWMPLPKPYKGEENE